MLLKNWLVTLPIAVRKVFEKFLPTFVNATSDDVAEILTIEELSFKSPWSRESLVGQLSDPLSKTIMAKSPGQNINYGYSCCKVIIPEAEILRIAVKPELRRCGIGRSLLDESLRCLQKIRVKTVHLEVSEKNLGALALYKKMGFFISGRRAGYYTNGTSAALLLMRKFE